MFDRTGSHLVIFPGSKHLSVCHMFCDKEWLNQESVITYLKFDSWCKRFRVCLLEDILTELTVVVISQLHSRVCPGLDVLIADLYCFDVL